MTKEKLPYTISSLFFYPNHLIPLFSRPVQNSQLLPLHHKRDLELLMYMFFVKNVDLYYNFTLSSLNVFLKCRSSQILRGGGGMSHQRILLSCWFLCLLHQIFCRNQGERLVLLLEKYIRRLDYRHNIEGGINRA